jgi:hypothetical protein
MSLVQYTISNNSSVGKTFSYFSASIAYDIFVDGFSSSSFIGDDTPSPTLVITGSMVSEDQFVSDAYIPPSGSAWLWNNGDKVQYIKISNTPLTGSNISAIINRAQWIDFSMVEAVDKNGNFLYPNSPNTARVERYIINNSNNRGTYNSVIINSSSPNTSNAVFANTSSVDTGFSYIDQQFNIDVDCNPILNNAIDSRTNEWLQNVDYSVNAVIPVNLEQILSGSATKATVPQSNYTQLGFAHSRYEGSSTSRSKINEYNSQSRVDIENNITYDISSPLLINKGKGPSLGKIPNVELNNSYIAYFNKILDPYPTLNNKVAYYIKYLIDDAGNILNPNLSDINYSILSETFQLKDYDNLPTRVNVGISNIDESKELSQLNQGLASIFKVGEYPVPILYSQTSSIGHSNSIPLSGSNFFTELGVLGDITNFGININAIQTDAPVASSADSSVVLNIGELEWTVNDLLPTSGNDEIPTSSISPNYSLLFPLDTNGNPSNTLGGDLSDNYIIKGSFTFTTSTIPSEYAGRNSKKNYLDDFDSRKIYKSNSNRVIKVDLIPHRKSPTSTDNPLNYIVNTSGFRINGVRLVITTNPGASNENVNIPLLIESIPQGYGKQWEITPNGFVLTPDSLYIEDLIIQKLLFQNDVRRVSNRRAALPLIAGGWANSGVNTIGFGNVPVKYDWIIEFEFNEIKQGTGLFLKANSSILIPQNGGKHGLFNQRPNDVFTYYGAGGNENENLQWRRTFTPTYSTGVNTKPILTYNVISPLSGNNVVKNQAIAPFWRKYPDSFSTLPTCECYSISALPDPLLPTAGVTFFYVNCNGDFDTIFLDPLTSDYICSTVLPTAFPSDRAIITKELDDTLCGGCGSISSPPSLLNDELYMSSSILNETYVLNRFNNFSFIQAKLPYNGDKSTDFPLTVEPGFIEFDPVVDKWGLEEGDEIRFENNENLTFVITKIIDDRINLNSELPQDKLRVKISPPLPNEPINLDFFVVRRYKENRNFIILDQQMPYGYAFGQGTIDYSGEDIAAGVEPVTRASSPGVLLPEHRIDKFNKNPDLVLKDLIEKNII